MTQSRRVRSRHATDIEEAAGGGQTIPTRSALEYDRCHFANPVFPFSHSFWQNISAFGSRAQPRARLEQNENLVKVRPYENPSHSAIAIRQASASEIRYAVILIPSC